jgi:hypothetical protein
MPNPLTALIALQLELLDRYLSLTKQVLETCVAYQPVAVKASNPIVNVPALRKGSCVGPADLRS